ncbi:conserved protein, unknown function [Hepatocystis sp. ex Piliocolobus tephrosceles]|nr:conserved protein, unknown function [Hepatocystis sp. ex Piliocolobus tephrosceles]
MLCCQKNIIDTVSNAKKSVIIIHKDENKKEKNAGNDGIGSSGGIGDSGGNVGTGDMGGTALIAQGGGKLSLINLLKKSNENVYKTKHEKYKANKNKIVSKSDVFKYYEYKYLIDKYGVRIYNRNLNNNDPNSSERYEDVIKEIDDITEFSKLDSEDKCKKLNEVQNKINEYKKRKKLLNIHDDFVFTNIYKLTHKLNYTMLDEEKNNVERYNCNKVLEMLFQRKLKRKDLIKNKLDIHYVHIEDKLNEFFIIKNSELQYYINNNDIITTVPIEFLNKEENKKEEIVKEEKTKETSELKEKNESDENIYKSFNEEIKRSYNNNIEIILMPKYKKYYKFHGYYKIVLNLHKIKLISNDFYHSIENKIEKYIINKKKGHHIHVKLKLKTNYPQALKTLIRYIHDTNFKLSNLPFRLLVTIYIICMDLKFYDIINNIVKEINVQTNFNNIIHILDLSSICKQTPIFKDFIRIIVDSADYIFREEYHYFLDVDMYSYFLSFDNLMVNEMKIFIESLKYITKKKCTTKEQELIFKNIRFDLIHIDENTLNILQQHNKIYDENTKTFIPPLSLTNNNNNSSNNNNNSSNNNSNNNNNNFFIENNENNENNNNNRLQTEVAHLNENIINNLSIELEKNLKIDNSEYLLNRKVVVNNMTENTITNDICDNNNNLFFSEEIKNKNEALQKIENNKNYFITINKNKNIIDTNNMYNILINNMIRSVEKGTKDIIDKKERCKVCNINKYFDIVYDKTDKNYSFNLVKKKYRVDNYAYICGDEKLINEYTSTFQIVNTKNSNIIIGVVLKTIDLSNPIPQLNPKIPNFLFEYNNNLVIYFDFLVNDFYACNINDISSSNKKDNYLTLLNKTKLNIYSHSNKLTNNDIIQYSITVINQTLYIYIKILPKNICFTYSFVILKPNILLGDIIKKPFIHVKPFFMLKDSSDAISISSLNF